MTIQDITRLIVLLTFTEYGCRPEHEKKCFWTAVFLREQRVKVCACTRPLTTAAIMSKIREAYFMLLFTGNIPRGVFCERRSQKTRDISREFMRLA